MKKLILLSLSSALLLTACGGGGGGAAPAAAIPVPFFTEVPAALQVNMPYAHTTVTAPVAIDINHDGKDDFVMHMWSAPLTVGVANSSPCVNQLQIFIKQPDDKFLDQTSSYIDGSTDLGGCARKVRVADINGDGKDDLIYAINQEDGRYSTNMNDWDAQMAALVSVGSKYVIQKFGAPSWYHSIGIMNDSVGNNLVTGAGYTHQLTSAAYQFIASGNVFQATSIVPPISANSFEFLSNGALGRESNLLIQASNQLNEYTSAEGYIKRNGQWNRISSLPLAPLAGYVDAIGYDMSSQPNSPVFQINGKYLTFAGMSETCKIKLTPTSDPIVLFNIGGGIIPNYPTNTTVKQTDLAVYSTFVGVAIQNEQLVQVPINITTQTTNSIKFDCVDVNNDGYDDIVVSPISTDGIVQVYLNNHNNGFTYFDKVNFPVLTNLNQSEQMTSMLHDFDGDKIPDLLIFPTEKTGTGSATIKYFKGNKYMK
jgi:hypothetical protein